MEFLLELLEILFDIGGILMDVIEDKFFIKSSFKKSKKRT